MTAKLQNTKVLAGIAGGLAVLILAAGWLLLVSPQRSKASDPSMQIAGVQSDIAARRAALNAKPKISSARASDVYRLTKAIPDRADMTGILLTLDRVAGGTGVKLTSVAPGIEVIGAGYNVQPTTVMVDGRFTQVSAFLQRLRHLVTVRHGRLDSRGRLFAVDSVEFSESTTASFPAISATIVLDAFVYAGGSGPATTTTPSTDATGSPNAVAAGAPSNG